MFNLDIKSHGLIENSTQINILTKENFTLTLKSADLVNNVTYNFFSDNETGF